MQEPSAPRYFTLDEANALVPTIRDLLETVQRQAAELARIQQQLAVYGRNASTNGHGTNGAGRTMHQAFERADALLAGVRAGIEAIQQTGAELKDVQTGLVDFRAMRDGREVYLCWKQGEDRIDFWHDLDTGFAGRQPL